ncbi:MAG: hypothetical protein U0168_05180 [Nannocystaceae bacterium]
MPARAPHEDRRRRARVTPWPAVLLCACYTGAAGDAGDGSGSSSGSSTGGGGGSITTASTTVGTTTAAAGSDGSGSSGAHEDTAGSSGATTLQQPDMGMPITEPMAQDCGTLDVHAPPSYDIYGDRYGAAWGFVVGEREYAAHANTYGLSIVDVTEVPLVEVGYLALPGNVPGRALAGVGTTVYVGGQGPGGSLAMLRVVDVSDPTAPALVSERPEFTDQIHTIDVFDDVLYLNSGFGACRFLTLDDPTNPTLVGSYVGNDCHDALAVGDRLFVAGGYTQHWDIVDISDLTAPAVLGVTGVEPGIYAHSGVLDPSGQYFLGLDEFHVGDVWIYDVSDPALPTFVSTFSLGDDVIPHNAIVRGNYVYAAWYEAGFVLLDIHDPTAPFEALRMPTWPDAPMGDWNGALEIDMHLPSGKVLVSDSREGLFVFCVQTPP